MKRLGAWHCRMSWKIYNSHVEKQDDKDFELDSVQERKRERRRGDWCLRLRVETNVQRTISYRP